MVSPEPVSADVFIPITVSDPSAFSLPGGGVTIVNGTREAVATLVDLTQDPVDPRLTIQPGTGFTIGDGFAVPEPSTASLLGLGLVGLTVVRRRWAIWRGAVEPIAR